MKKHKNFVRYILFYITYAVDSAPSFTSILTIVPNFEIIFIFIFIFIVYSRKDSQIVFPAISLLHTLPLFPILSNACIIDTEYSQGIHSPVFVVDD